MENKLNLSIHKAINFAAKAHENQKRKGTDLPYIVHLFEVCQILSYLECPDYIICAGILHDIVEDTCYSIDDIKDNFGEKVSNIVANESENKDLSWEERKEYTINNISKKSLDVVLVLFADKISNLRSLYYDYIEMGDKLWDKFNRGKEKQEWYYKNIYLGLSKYIAYQKYSMNHVDECFNFSKFNSLLNEFYDILNNLF